MQKYVHSIGVSACVMHECNYWSRKLTENASNEKAVKSPRTAPLLGTEIQGGNDK